MTLSNDYSILAQNKQVKKVMMRAWRQGYARAIAYDNEGIELFHIEMDNTDMEEFQAEMNQLFPSSGHLFTLTDGSPSIVWRVK